MDITVNENGSIQLGKVYNSVVLKTDDGEEMVICMRDSGFEFTYQGSKYSAQKGEIDLVQPVEDNVHFDPCPKCGSHLKSASGGGVKCSNGKCDHWECF
jgi:hypothetical protein